MCDCVGGSVPRAPNDAPLAPHNMCVRIRAHVSACVRACACWRSRFKSHAVHKQIHGAYNIQNQLPNSIVLAMHMRRNMYAVASLEMLSGHMRTHAEYEQKKSNTHTHTRTLGCASQSCTFIYANIRKQMQTHARAHGVELPAVPKNRKVWADKRE